MAGHMKKEYLDCMGKPVLVRALSPFLENPSYYPIIITVPQDGIDFVASLVAKYVKCPDIRFIEGGSSRQASVHRALAALEESNPDFVLIHDGARPWVTRALIDAVAKAAGEYGGCIPVVRFSDAPKEIDQDGFVKTNLSHASLRGAQTPQGFEFASILEAHTKAANEGIEAPDDAELYCAYAGRVYTVQGDPENRKITYMHDLTRL